MTRLVRWAIEPIQTAVAAVAEQVVGRDPMAVESISAELPGSLTRPQVDDYGAVVTWLVAGWHQLDHPIRLLAA